MKIVKLPQRCKLCDGDILIQSSRLREKKEQKYCSQKCQKADQRIGVANFVYRPRQKNAKTDAD